MSTITNFLKRNQLRQYAFLLVFIFICWLNFIQDICAAPVPNTLQPSTHQSIAITAPAPPDLNVKAYVLMDYNSGDVLAEKNSHIHLPPASLTKLMTAYIVENMLDAGRIKATDTARVSEKAWRTGGSTMFLEVGEKVAILELLKGLIIVSGNDSAVTLSEYIAGSEGAFVSIMNATARKMNLQDSHFEDSNGLPNKEHYSSAYDIAVISRHIIMDHPQFYPIYKIKEFQHGVDKSTGKPLNPQPNRLGLLWSNSYVDGLKTGHTQDAGFCLAASVNPPTGQRLIAVVLGAPTNHARDKDAQSLFTYGERFFSSIQIANAEKTIKKIRIWKGVTNQLTIAPLTDVWISVHKSEASQLTTKFLINKKVVAPIKKGDKLGTIQISLKNKIIKQVPLLATNSVERSGLFSRLWDSTMMLFDQSSN